MANRYTQLTASEYKPVDLQTMMIAPAMMRQRHDQADAQREQLRSTFNMFGDVLPYHTEELQKYKDEFNSLVNTEADQLARYGVGKNTNANLIRLNSQYQNLMNPNGRIGKMTAAKADYIAKKNAFIENAIKDQKYSLADAERNWNKHVQGYTGYDGIGGIEQIASLGAPTREDLTKDVKHIKDITGEIQKVASKLGYSNAEIRTDLGNALEVVTSTGEKIIDHNLDNLLSGANMLITKWLVPGNSGYETAEFEDTSPDEIMNQITSSIKAMTKHKVTDTRKQTSDFKGYSADNLTSDNDFYVVNTGTIEDPRQVPAKDLDNARTEMMRLQDIKRVNPNALSAEDARLLKDYELIVSEADDILKNNSAYTEYMSKNRDRIDRESNKIFNDAGFTGSYDPNKLERFETMRGDRIIESYVYDGKTISTNVAKNLMDASRLPREIQKIQDDAFNNSLVERRELNRIATDSKKRQPELDQFDNNIKKNLTYDFLINNNAQIINANGKKAKGTIESYEKELPQLMSENIVGVERAFSDGTNREILRVTYAKDTNSKVKIDGVALKDQNITIDIAMPSNKFSKLSGTSNIGHMIDNRFRNSNVEVVGQSVVGVNPTTGEAITQRDESNYVSLNNRENVNFSASEARFGNQPFRDALYNFTSAAKNSPSVNRATVSAATALASELESANKLSAAEDIKKLIDVIKYPPSPEAAAKNIEALKAKLMDGNLQPYISNILESYNVNDLQ